MIASAVSSGFSSPQSWMPSSSVPETFMRGSPSDSVESMWKCASMKGGLASRPVASISRGAFACSFRSTAALRPPSPPLPMRARPPGSLAWGMMRSTGLPRTRRGGSETRPYLVIARLWPLFRHRLFPDVVRPGPFGCLGDHEVRAAGEKDLHRPLIGRRVEIAGALVGMADELGDLAHHPLLVLLRLDAGLVVLQHDHSGVVRIGDRPVPALHGRLDEAGELVGHRRVTQVLLQRVDAVLERGHALILILEDDELVGREAGVDHL